MTAHPTPTSHAPGPGCSRRSLLLIGLCAALAALPSAGAAQSRACGPRDVVIARLAETYGETRQSIGLGSDNAVMEVFASDETGTWTITITSSQGVTCLVASGQAFETLAEHLPPKESDA
ncbi:hypothetical protein CEW88_11170 [Alloyangia pacifica]|uniref:Uncharacterized protein n=1 Tax=Alloyangia pacifica TaxID=311180 RepID=A0A2U8HEE3_9RHOB|nr:hypothetical protein [Alloyangia pacifica]AWI84194.1 hypothetical protein CEW88_11170 [Alloyangia pacifica]